MKLSLHPYQVRAAKFCLGQGAAGLFLPPGYGKTAISLTVFNTLRTQNMVRRALVLAPLRPALTVWTGERDKWDDFQHLDVQVLHGKNKTVAALKAADLAVLNYDGIPWLAEALKSEREFPFDMLIVDELSKLKHPQTRRFKTLKPLLPKFKRRLGLTGTPAPNGLMDLFGQIYVLDLGSALGRFITHYRTTYFTPSGYGGYDWKLQPGAEERIYTAIRPLVLRLEDADYLQMPELLYNTVRVALPEVARKAYSQVEVDLLTELNGQTITAANAAAATNKLRQIANGGAYYTKEDGSRGVAQIHDAKTEALVDLVEELQGQPAFVAYEFASDLERLQKAFPGAPHIGGGTTAAQQKDIEARWNAGEIPVLFAQPQSVAHGCNLQGTAAAVVWYGIPWDCEVYEQFIRRVWRQGQKSKVVVHHIAAEKTVDETVLRVLRSKAKTQSALLDALKEDLTHPA